MADILDAPVAGPSRLSPRPSSPRQPLPVVMEADVEMRETKAEAVERVVIAPGPHSQEAAELLLGFSTIEPRYDDKATSLPPLDPPSPPRHIADPPKVEIIAARSTFPYTPPDDPHPEPSTHYANPLSHADTAHLASSPAAVSDAGPSKPKPKRKRGQPSRRTSTDPARPPHFMGEDNEVIRCICGIDEDDGLTIQCELCYAWQHALCFGYADAESAPEIYFCELCQPRPYDRSLATERQVLAKSKRDRERSDEVGRLGMGLPAGPAVVSIPGASEKPKSRGKGKRARVDSAQEGEALDRAERDPSPGAMAPPMSKPRRKPGPKPKPKPPSTPHESTPAPTYQPPLPLPEAEDEYFTVEPWTMEYTPVKNNVVRGGGARRIMSRLYREWVDAEDEVLASKRSVSGPSGLPSPTDTGVRLSPDDLFPSPDLSTLAPPVPPVSLFGPDLSSLGAQTVVKSVSPSLSFLPLSYLESSSDAAYIRPALYGVYVKEAIHASAFVGEFRAEVTDCESYRRDRINQYAAIGMTKPHVYPIGPPVNLMLDARGYGCELRFIRSGCHPNVVLRPLLWRMSETDQPKLRFGVFASREIFKGEELVLEWAWDDAHIVHALRSHVHPTALADGFPGRPSFPPSSGPSSPAYHALLDRFELVLTHLLGTFSSCACKSMGHCAIAQMRYLVEIRDDERSPAGRRGQRAHLGALVGAVRGWRRREEEVQSSRRWEMPEVKEAMERGWRRKAGDREESVEQGREGRAASVAQSTRSRSRSKSLAGAGVEDGLLDPESEDEGEGESAESEAGEDMDVDESGSEEVESPPRPNARARSGTASASPLSSLPGARPATPPRLPASPSASLSPALSSAHRPRPRRQSPASDDGDEDDDEGHLSDATTATVPRSASEDEEMDVEVEGEEERSTAVPVRQPNGTTTGAGMVGRKRRVVTLSPVHEDLDDAPTPPAKEDESASPAEPSLTAQGRASKVPRIRKDGKEDKRFKSRPPPSAPSPNVQVASLPNANANAVPAPIKRGRPRIMSSPTTEDDGLEMLRRGLADERDGKRERGIASSLFPHEPVAQVEPKLEHEQAKEEHEHEHEDMDMDMDMDMDRIATPPLPASPSPPPKLPTPPPPEPPKKVALADWLRNKKIQKLQSTDPFVSPAPAPIPPAIAPGSETAAAFLADPEPSLPPPRSAAADDVVAKPEAAQPETQRTFNLQDFLPATVTPAPGASTGGYGSQVYDSPRPAGLSTPSSTSYVPRSEYFPPPAPTPSFQPRTSSSYTPRPSVSTDSEYAPPTPAPAVPAAAYVPRTITTPIEESKPLPGGTSADDLPNGSGWHGDAPASAYRPRPRSPSLSPVRSTVGLADSSYMPPPLTTREPPPHQSVAPYPSASLSPDVRMTALPSASASLSPADRTSPLPRIIPTGPKGSAAPPTGPRGSWGQNQSLGLSTQAISTPTAIGNGGNRGRSGSVGTTPNTPITPSGPRGPLPPGPGPGPGSATGPIPVPLRGGYPGSRGMYEGRGGWRGRGYPPRGAWGR